MVKWECVMQDIVRSHEARKSAPERHTWRWVPWLEHGPFVTAASPLCILSQENYLMVVGEMDSADQITRIAATRRTNRVAAYNQRTYPTRLRIRVHYALSSLLRCNGALRCVQLLVCASPCMLTLYYYAFTTALYTATVASKQRYVMSANFVSMRIHNIRKSYNTECLSIRTRYPSPGRSRSSSQHNQTTSIHSLKHHFSFVFPLLFNFFESITSLALLHFLDLQQKTCVSHSLS